MQMKKKVIIFGLGAWYRKYSDIIRANYEIVGVTSNDAEQAKVFSNYIPIEDISQYRFDSIIVCINEEEMDVVNQLVNDIHISLDKIILINELMLEKIMGHSQMDEDITILFLLSLLKINKEDVYYIELGTNHPMKGSNTYALYLRGGHGVLVEPNRRLKNLIKLVRPRDVLIEKALSLDGEAAVFYELTHPSISTLDYSAIDDEYKNEHEGFRVKETYTVDTITINELMESLERVPDVFSIDIEGLDYEILTQMDLEKYRPAVMIVELFALGAKKQNGDKIEQLLKENKYQRFHSNGLNAIYVDKKYMDIIRDYIVL